MSVLNLKQIESIENLVNVLNRFSCTYLKDMQEVSLMNRVDTKFILNGDKLSQILESAIGNYDVLEIEGSRQMSYTNQYFDTENRKFYTDHHNGKKRRSKVRIRRYDDSDILFLEVKQKNNKGRTNKVRRQIQFLDQELSTENKTFIEDQLNIDLKLEPTVRNSFKRITLVGPEERVTFDTELVFQNGTDQLKLENLVIAEIKQNQFSRTTDIFGILSENRIKPYRISKYCIGMASLYENVKQNRFKEKMIKINKITA